MVTAPGRASIEPSKLVQSLVYNDKRARLTHHEPTDPGQAIRERASAKVCVGE
jgi:hypothetical protein